MYIQHCNKQTFLFNFVYLTVIGNNINCFCTCLLVWNVYSASAQWRKTACILCPWLQNPSAHSSYAGVLFGGCNAAYKKVIQPKLAPQFCVHEAKGRNVMQAHTRSRKAACSLKANRAASWGVYLKPLLKPHQKAFNDRKGAGAPLTAHDSSDAKHGVQRMRFPHWCWEIKALCNFLKNSISRSF